MKKQSLHSHHVVIIGAGYAGVMTANRLASSQDAPHRYPRLTITLVSTRSNFVERIRLHEYAAGSRESVTIPFGKLLNPAVRIVQGTAEMIHVTEGRENTVSLNSGLTLPFDSLIYAVGSETVDPTPDQQSTANYESASSIRSLAPNLPAGTRVLVAGGGLTGIETAAELAESHPRLRVILHSTGALAPGVSPRARARIRYGLRKLRVEIHENTMIVPEAEHHVRCVGFTYPKLAATSGLPIDSQNRLVVDHTLRVREHPQIFGIGDAAVIHTENYRHLRPGCATAMPLGSHAAENILASLQGAPLTAHTHGYVFQCISLGRRDAVIQFVRGDDTPRKAFLSGRLAAVFKEQICRYTIRELRIEGKRFRSYSWPRGKSHSNGTQTRIDSLAAQES
ncbi:FAD-dependent oxidoreductase [Lysinibacter sp. HNR]|uniref:NAD(P)/FAD-dependent oxidoreductase n=1 Tax=Lysinibacter sp. HNR TaxID=3031408 RepID=UPI002435D576|nr:FAD-dependent oxidoreductase [Lysinibacter sp. HNR]WGD38516.1 FAD-dependent oxidoreductase [Lysinibacter sp. HNR]